MRLQCCRLLFKHTRCRLVPSGCSVRRSMQFDALSNQITVISDQRRPASLRWSDLRNKSSSLAADVQRERGPVIDRCSVSLLSLAAADRRQRLLPSSCVQLLQLITWFVCILTRLTFSLLTVSADEGTILKYFTFKTVNTQMRNREKRHSSIKCRC